MIELFAATCLLATEPSSIEQQNSHSQTTIEENHPGLIWTGYGLANLCVSEHQTALDFFSKAEAEISDELSPLKVLIALGETVANDNLGKQTECEASFEKFCAAIEYFERNDGSFSTRLSAEQEESAELLKTIASLSSTPELREVLLAILFDFIEPQKSSFDGLNESLPQNLNSQSFWSNLEKIVKNLRNAACKFSIFMRDLTDIHTTLTMIKH